MSERIWYSTEEGAQFVTAPRKVTFVSLRKQNGVRGLVWGSQTEDWLQARQSSVQDVCIFLLFQVPMLPVFARGITLQVNSWTMCWLALKSTSCKALKMAYRHLENLESFVIIYFKKNILYILENYFAYNFNAIFPRKHFALSYNKNLDLCIGAYYYIMGTLHGAFHWILSSHGINVCFKDEKLPLQDASHFSKVTEYN